MIFSVRNQDVSFAIYSNSFQSFELSIILSPPTEGSQKCPVRVEYLYPVVAGVCYENESLLIDSHTPVNGNKC